MSLPHGTRLGTYVIDSLIGAGGMGEVYKAHDPRFGRDVAVKVLPQSVAVDRDRLARFEQEARAIGALNHPNVLAVHDVGSADGVPYLVSELLDGQTLRDRMNESPLPLRKALELAGQITAGLHAAHAKGIVHRDLKPENVFVTKDGRAKILDFGLAKLTAREVVPDGATMTVNAKVATAAGLVMGTVGYMSPEQVRGAAVDHRSDLFAFGAMLYEMVAGRRAFHGESAIETLNAILKEDPPSPAPDRPLPPGVDRVIRRCLEKSPDERFESARDIAFALDAVSTPSGSSVSVPAVAAPAAPRRAYGRAALLVAAGVAAGAAAVWLAPKPVPLPLAFQPMTFSRGYLRVARFTAEGQTIVHGGRWNGPEMKVWFQRHDAPLFSPLPIPDADLLAVSSKSELAVSLRRRQERTHVLLGTLARVPMSGGAPRELLEDVLDADWSPDGSELAVIRRVAGRFRLEHPIGTVLHETPGYLSDVRFSPAGDLIAFMDHPIYGDDRGTVVVIDRKGTRRMQSQEWETEQGLAWRPDGREVWFGMASGLYAVDLSGTSRAVLQTPALSIRMQDIARDGRVLISRQSQETSVRIGATTGGASREFSWFAYGWDHDIAPDGSFVVYNALPTGTANYTLYLQRADGQPPVELGEGRPVAVSADSKTVVAIRPLEDSTLLVVPTGTGDTRRIRSTRLHYRDAFWLPGGRLLVAAFQQGGRVRAYLQDLSEAEPTPLAPEGMTPVAVSPDGARFLTRDDKGAVTVHRIPTGESHPITGIDPKDEVVQWTDRGILVAAPGLPLTIQAVDPATGKRALWRQFADLDQTGLSEAPRICVTPDGAHYLVAADRLFVSMFIVRGAR